MLRRLIAPAAGLAMAGLVATTAPAGAAALTFTTTMTGSQERPVPGSPTASGTARVTVDPASGRICFVLLVSGLDTPTAAHIHEAPAGSPGPVVVPLPAPVNGRSAGCVTNATEASAIAANPSDYYVNVHTAEFPGGALRGQL
ncbi:MAG: CHRD domain-containing protein [Acidimicrobiales bacterium]